MSRPSASRLGLAIALVLSAPLLTQDLYAQDAPASATTLDTVIVTGTRAVDRTVLESTACPTYSEPFLPQYSLL